jgi:hypothetical protein
MASRDYINFQQYKHFQAQADRSWGKGARPISRWTKGEFMRMFEKKFSKVEAAVADSFPQWFLQCHFLRLSEEIKAETDEENVKKSETDKEAVEALMENPEHYRELYTREAKQRNMQGKLKNRFAKEWARRYGLYRKYYDYGFDDNVFLDDKISLAALSKKLYSMAFAYHSAKRKEESES